MPHSLIRPGLHVHGDCNASPEGKVERADGAYLQRMRRRRKRPSSKSEAKAAAKQVKMKEEKRAPSAFAHCSKAVLRAVADASLLMLRTSCPPPTPIKDVSIVQHPLAPDCASGAHQKAPVRAASPRYMYMCALTVMR